MNQQKMKRLVEELLEVLVRHLGECTKDYAAVGPKRWLSNAEAADELGISARTLTQWRYQRKGPKVYRSGNIVRYKPADLSRWLEENSVDGAIA